MIFFIDTSDKRNIYVMQGLKDLGYQCVEWPTEQTSNNKQSVYVFSPAKKLTDLTLLNKNSIVFGGKQSHEVVLEMQQKNIEYFNLMQNEIFTINNAKLTAEGVLAVVIASTEKSIFSNNVLVLGSGRCGKTIVLLLEKLGIKVTVATFHKDSYENAYVFTNDVLYKDELEDEINKFDIIINTVPLPIISPKLLENMQKDVAVIEVASINCISNELLNKYKINYILAPALPKVYSAFSAGHLMLKQILNTLTKEE